MLNTPTAMMTYAKMITSQDVMMSAPCLRIVNDFFCCVIHLLVDYRRDRAERLTCLDRPLK